MEGDNREGLEEAKTKSSPLVGAPNYQKNFLAMREKGRHLSPGKGGRACGRKEKKRRTTHIAERRISRKSAYNELMGDEKAQPT